MSCTNTNYFKDIKKGDTFTGLKMTFYNGTGTTKTAMNLTGASIVINFKKGEGQNPIFSFKKSDNTITIPTPANGEIFLQPRVMNYPAFNYMFDVVVTTASGTIHTYFSSYWQIY
jgi:hypothetical protein